VSAARWIWIALVAAGAIGCRGEKGPDALPPSVGDPLLTADGRHFAAERVYEGECAPAGSRGGCHTITFRPDGTYRVILFDAALEGTYQIRGDLVVMSAPPDMREELPLSADRTRLGELSLKR
jgi:hypothetical protein